MVNRMRGVAWAALLGFSFAGARAHFAQDRPADSPPAPPAIEQRTSEPNSPQVQAPQPVSLIVQPGVPLHIALDKPVPIKRAGVPVEGHTLEPIYVFNHLVIPAGSKVQGRVSRVDNASRKQRGWAIANGNFTPLRTAHLDFDALVFKDNKRIPLQTRVSPGTPPIVHLVAGEGGKKKGRVRGAVDQARAQAEQREHDTLQTIKSPGKMERLKGMLAAELPYHRLVLRAGTHFTAEIEKPLDFGTLDCPAQELLKLGSEIPLGSTVHVRLLTALSSGRDKKGDPVQAVISEPVFSPDHQLILPEGARLEGSASQALPARRLGRNGQLRFSFHQIELPQQQQATVRRVEASLQAVDVATGGHVEVDSEGGAHAVTPKTKYIAPAIDVLLATSSLDGLDPHNHHRIEAGLGREGPDAVGGAVRGGAGFGLVGSVIGLVAHWRPVSACFAFYGAGWSVYTHVVARGNDVVFPKNTPMEIRFGTHEGQTPAAKGKAFAAVNPKPASAY